VVALAAPAHGSLDAFLREAGRYPQLPLAEEAQTAERAAAGDRCARQRLIESNLRLVVAIAKDHRDAGLPFLDVIHEGLAGLVDAADSYDPRAGNGFSSYAAWWVKRTIRAATAAPESVFRPQPDGPLQLAA
jgi:RNA polymerase primary sigma factor